MAQLFEKKGPTTCNIIQWKKKQVASRKILKKKKRGDSNLWIYDSNLNDVIKELVRI